jgi:hypothetical protein
VWRGVKENAELRRLGRVFFLVEENWFGEEDIREEYKRGGKNKRESTIQKQEIR